MKERRIMIIGCPGSGKSTLSEQLNKITAIPLYHLDKINWIDSHSTLSREEFFLELQHVLELSEWIIDGNYNHTLGSRMEKADLIIWLDLPRYVCTYRIIKRLFKPNHKHGNPDKLERGFLKFVWNFNKKNKPRMLELQKKYETQKSFVRISSQKQLQEWISHVEKEAEKND